MSRIYDELEDIKTRLRWAKNSKSIGDKLSELAEAINRLEDLESMMLGRKTK